MKELNLFNYNQKFPVKQKQELILIIMLKSFNKKLNRNKFGFNLINKNFKAKFKTSSKGL